MAALTSFRFTHPSEQVRHDALPVLESVSVAPTVVDPGRSMGTRASVTVSVRDFLHQFDSEPLEQGTFWGKLRARTRSLQGSVLRLIRGEDGQDVEDMDTEHYVIESLSRSAERVTIVAKDLLKLADDDRAQAPRVSNGRLLEAIDADDSSFTLTPSGIGDAEYPASGKLALGGKEIVAFTRTGDVCSISRAQSGTAAVPHDADEIAQLVLIYDAESAAAIIYDLLTSYTTIDPSWCDLDAWQADIDTYVGRLYSAEIAIPTGVRTLCNELIEQVGLVNYWDAEAQQVRLKSLRPITTSARSVGTDEIMQGSFGYQEQPDKRVSEVWTYYALRNPLAKLDDPQNYASAVATIGTLDEDLPDQPTAVKKIFSRWITAGNRTAAERLNDMLLARYNFAPRKFSFSLYRTSDKPTLAQGLQLTHWTIQDANGLAESVPCQITSINRSEDRYACTAEEMLFNDDGANDRVVIIDTDSYQINLRELYDAIYSPPDEYSDITFVIESGVFVGVQLYTLGGNATTNVRALEVGDWPEGPQLRLINNGTISGGGGAGADARIGGAAGAAGSHGLYTRYPITIENNGTIAGGGGGGGRGTSKGGGGGAGRTQFGAFYGDGYAPGGPNSDWFAGSPSHAQSGQATTGGLAQSADGGDGGDLGEAGEAGASTSGGIAGNAVDGESLVTYDTEGTIIGPRVN